MLPAKPPARPLRIGVIGCGRVAQVMHLPFLVELPQFEIAALADVSEDVLTNVGERYPSAARHTDYRVMLARDDVDAVAVLTVDHAEIAESAATAGKHVFVEKPLCFGVHEGRRLLKAAEASGVTLMTGYMRRFDPAFHVLQGALAELGEVRFVRARDILGVRSNPVEIYTTFLPPRGASASVSEQPGIESRLLAALDTDDGREAELYWFVLMLGIHDLSVLHGLFGPATEVVSTVCVGSRHLITTLRYPPSIHVSLELGVFPDRTWNDTRLEVLSDAATVSLEYPNPWVRYGTTSVVHRVSIDGKTVDRIGPHSFNDPFREEWLEFHESITTGREPATPGRDGLVDVELAASIVRAIPQDQLDRFRSAA